MNDVISVIMPVYNVEAYLPECVESVLNQDYDKLEVILIDDGSTDTSGELCDQYGARDPRVRVIHQKNAGAAAAKNAGLEMATGEYLSFVDSDDFLEPNVYGYMVALLEQTGADAGVFSFQDVYRNRQQAHILHEKREILTGQAYLERFVRDWSCALLWNKLYKRRLFAGVFFEEGHKIDDEYFTYQGFLNAENVVCDSRIVYNYRRRASSVMLSPKSRAQIALDRVDFTAKRRERVAVCCPELREVFDRQFLDAMIYMSEDALATAESIVLTKEKLRDYFRGNNTFPPRYFWLPLLKLRCLPVESLLKARKADAGEENVEDCFP